MKGQKEIEEMEGPEEKETSVSKKKKKRTMAVHICLPVRLVEIIDGMARSISMARGSFVRMVITNYIDSKGFIDREIYGI